ncbi:MAG: amidohydrolase family protein, partial [Planctomycetota bacterium]
QASHDGPAYIDVHTHFGRKWNQKMDLTARTLLKWMDEHHIERSCVLPLVSPESSSYPLSNNFVFEESRPHRDRLIPFCCFDPRTSYSGRAKGVIEILKPFVEDGAKGFGEHKTGVRIDDTRSMYLFEACAELKLPVLFHLDSVRNIDEAGLPGLERVLEAFPTVDFIGHAQGWWNSISGDAVINTSYPKTPVTPGGAIDRLMDKFPNIYGDLSAGSGNNALARDPEFGRKFVIRRADRLMFGTDYLMTDQVVRQFETLASFNLPGDVKQKVFRDNAIRVLKLDA